MILVGFSYQAMVYIQNNQALHRYQTWIDKSFEKEEVQPCENKEEVF